MSFDSCHNRHPIQGPGEQYPIVTLTFGGAGNPIVPQPLQNFENFTASDQRLSEAKTFLLEKYTGLKRRSGHDAHSHPIEVAEILYHFSSELGSRPTRTNIILLALLHDILEDTFTSTQELLSLFGNEVCVYVSTLSRIPTTGNEDLDRINFESYIGGLDSAPSIIKVVKMADRLHNLRTLLITHDPLFIEKQLKEFTEVYEERFNLWSRDMKSPYHLLAAKLLGHIEAEAELIRKTLQRTSGQLTGELN